MLKDAVREFAPRVLRNRSIRHACIFNPIVKKHELAVRLVFNVADVPQPGDVEYVTTQEFKRRLE